MAQLKDKDQLIEQFTQFKGIEQEAHDFYMKIVNDPEVASQEVKDTFIGIAAQELEHVELVDKILTIINNNL